MSKSSLSTTMEVLFENLTMATPEINGRIGTDVATMAEAVKEAGLFPEKLKTNKKKETKKKDDDDDEEEEKAAVNPSMGKGTESAEEKKETDSTRGNSEEGASGNNVVDGGNAKRDDVVSPDATADAGPPWTLPFYLF